MTINYFHRDGFFLLIKINSPDIQQLYFDLFRE